MDSTNNPKGKKKRSFLEMFGLFWLNPPQPNDHRVALWPTWPGKRHSARALEQVSKSKSKEDHAMLCGDFKQNVTNLAVQMTPSCYCSWLSATEQQQGGAGGEAVDESG